MKTFAFIGYGFVGKACHKAFIHNVNAIIVDPKYSQTTIDELIISAPSLIFVSINAPTLDNREVDATVIYNIFNLLNLHKYAGLVVLKSTLPPDTVYDLHERYSNDKKGNLRYIYSPEFLKEHTWEYDALHPTIIMMAGNLHDCKELENIYKIDSHIDNTKYLITGYKEAALIKYTINSYLASKVVFMNQLYKLYADLHGNDNQSTWHEIVHALTYDTRIGGSHMSVPGKDGNFGYGGSCFPKDVKAMIGFDKNNRLTVLRETEIANTAIRLSE